MSREELVPFKSDHLTVYRGRGRSFAPGELSLVPKDHVADMTALDKSEAKRKMEFAAKLAADKAAAEKATTPATPKVSDTQPIKADSSKS